MDYTWATRGLHVGYTWATRGLHLTNQFSFLFFFSFLQGLNKVTGEFLAVKELFMDSLVDFASEDTSNTNSSGSYESSNNSNNKSYGYKMTKLEKEVNIMRKLSHINIVQYLGTEFISQPSPQFCILLEYVPGGSIGTATSRMD